MLAQDVVTRRLLWEQIDDASSVLWTDVLKGITIDDYAVFAGFSFGSLSFAGQLDTTYNPDTASWTQINDTQVPNWQEIVA